MPSPLTVIEAARSSVRAYRAALHRVREDASLSLLDAQTLLSETRTDLVVAVLAVNDVVGDATVGTVLGDRILIASYCATLARAAQLGAIGVRELDDALIVLSRVAAGAALIEEASAGRGVS